MTYGAPKACCHQACLRLVDSCGAASLAGPDFVNRWSGMAGVLTVGARPHAVRAVVPLDLCVAPRAVVTGPTTPPVGLRSKS